MRNSTLVVLSFLGLILLAASLIWFPRPNEPQNAEPGSPLALPRPVDSTAVAAGAGGNSESPAAKVETAAVPAEPQAPPNSPSTEFAKAPPAFLKWPAPKIAFVITGEQLGYFEPCGCTANQLGGMSRRAGLFAEMESLGWTVRGLDVGGISRRTGPQAQMKFETTLRALRELKYVSLALSPADLKLDPGYLLSQHVADGEVPLNFLSANLTFFGTKDLGTPLSQTIVTVGDYKIGITSVISDVIRREVIPDRTPEEAATADLQWGDPSEALTQVLAKFDEEKVNFRILLSQSTDEEIVKQAAAFPQFDIIVAAEGLDGNLRPEMQGNVRVLRVGEKGRTAGVVGLYPDDAENPVRYELVTISGDHFSESEKMTALMAEYQERLRDSSVATSDGPLAHPSGASFVGAAKCGECHTKAFSVWEKTAHAHAFESLDPANQRKGHERLHGIIRSFDPECIACHVTGWDPHEYLRFQGGFINREFAADDAEKQLHELLAGNQCENCHGPGSRHIELIEADNKEAAVKEVSIRLENAKAMCSNCHDADNSPEFSANFEKYWEQVKHSGTD